MPPEKGKSPVKKLQKKQKGHETKKPYNMATGTSQLSLLSQNSTSRKPTSFLLVILAISPSDEGASNDFMIGDFAGIKYHLNIMGFEEKKFFWSTIDLAKYCATSKYRDIKIRGETSEKVAYSSFKALHRQDDYEFVDEAVIKQKFLGLMADLARDKQAGDVVNIIIITHGNASSGDLQFGTGRITAKEMANRLSYIDSSVQVNMVLTACGSGILCKKIPFDQQKNRLILTSAAAGEFSSGNGLVGWVKGKSPSGRFRSSFFTDVIIKSLGQLNLDRLGPTMEQLQENAMEGVYTKPEPDWAKSKPTFAGSSFSQAESETALQKMLHLDYFDFPPEPKRASRYLRQESDMQVVAAASEDQVNDKGFGNTVLDFLRREVPMTDAPYLGNDDYMLHASAERLVDSSARGQEVSKAEVMIAIMFRARYQSACFAIYMFLIDQCLVTSQGIEEPMHLNNTPDQEIRDVVVALASFEFFAGRKKYPFRTYANMGYTSPVNWLATVIVRGAVVTDLWCLLDRLSCFGELGGLDVEFLRDAWAEGRQIKVNPKAGLVPAWSKGKWPAFCFWLPHSLGPISDLSQLYRYFDHERFVPFERLWFQYFRMPFDGQGARDRQCSSYIKEDMKHIDCLER